MFRNIRTGRDSEEVLLMLVESCTSWHSWPTSLTCSGAAVHASSAVFPVGDGAEQQASGGEPLTGFSSTSSSDQAGCSGGVGASSESESAGCWGWSRDGVGGEQLKMAVSENWSGPVLETKESSRMESWLPWLLSWNSFTTLDRTKTLVRMILPLVWFCLLYWA